MTNSAIIIFESRQGAGVVSRDLEVPLSITAGDLIAALNEAYSLGIPEDKLMESYMKADNPIALVRGSKTLAELGIHHGTTIRYGE